MEKETTKQNRDKYVRFTTVYHGARIRLGLTMNDYAVADLIYQLSNNPSARIAGWCFASKKYIGDMIGVSEQSVHSIINKLSRLGLVDKDNDTRYIRTTQEWYDAVIIGKSSSNTVEDNLSTAQETLVPLKEHESTGSRNLSPALKKLESRTKETLDNIYSYNNKDIVNNTDILLNPERNSVNQEVIASTTRLDVDVTERIELLYSLIRQNYPYLRIYLNDDNYSAMDKLHRLDGHPWHEIDVVIQWSQSDPFWRQNIRSAKKFREKFDDLMVRVDEANRQSQHNRIVKV